LPPRPFWIRWFVKTRQRSEKAWVSRRAGVMHGRGQFVFVAAWQRYEW